MNGEPPASSNPPHVTVVIPCFRVSRQVQQVLAEIGDEVDRIYVVDDACPENTGDLVEEVCTDHRVVVLRHARNTGVGGAVVTGYRRALTDGARIVVKLDGDGQMDPGRIPQLISLIVDGRADYVKGNRFRDFDALRAMPKLRLFGNSMLSFLIKAASGYWQVVDPTNGFTAISRPALRAIPLSKLAQDYFFESDMLIRLNVVGARVETAPMAARYGDEPSSLRVDQIVATFPHRILGGFVRRVMLKYFVYDFNMASVYLLLGLPLTLFGMCYGGIEWYDSFRTGIPRAGGRIMLAALPIIVGVEMLLQGVAVDIAGSPRRLLSVDDEVGVDA